MSHTSRRKFLGRLGVLAAAMARAPKVLTESNGTRSLAFAHTHTGKSLFTVYFEGGAYVPTALESINVLLRDFRTETVFPIEPQLLNRLYALQGRAIDIRLPGVDTAQLARLARRTLAGGVGYYKVSDFVHVDMGAVRNWGDPIGGES